MIAIPNRKLIAPKQIYLVKIHLKRHLILENGKVGIGEIKLNKLEFKKIISSSFLSLYYYCYY